MLRSMHELRGHTLVAQDGTIGRCKDFLFEDRTWVVRYMVADTRRWLPGRKVLVSPIALGEPDWNERRFPLRLTKEQLEKSPALGEDEPVGRRYEERWSRHFGWPYYWVGGAIWGFGRLPSVLYGAHTLTNESVDDDVSPEEETDHGGGALRSFREVEHYRIQASDGVVGYVKDMLVDDRSWAIRAVIVDTRKLLPGGSTLLVTPRSVAGIDWASKSVDVDLTRAEVEERAISS